MRREGLQGYLIFLGLILGVIIGWLLHSESPSKLANDLFTLFGETIFLGLLKMLIIPLLAVSVTVGITSASSGLGRLGTLTFIYFGVTMLIATGLGLMLVTIISPGVGFPNTPYSPPVLETSSAKGIAKNLIGQIIPDNIFAELSSGNPLPVIVFSIFFGIILSLNRDECGNLISLSNSAFKVLMEMVNVILWLAPIGVLSLLAKTVMNIGVSVFTESIGGYMLTVLIGLFIHGLIVLPLILFIFTKENPYRFLFQVKRALMAALGTSSSTATLPVSIESAIDEAKISPKVAGLVLPVGSTVNMDGTALYEAVAVVFLAQAFGVNLGGAELIVIALTATLAAVGAAGIPSAGLVTMVVVIDAVNQSLGASLIPATAIGIIMGVDRILDMFRTTVNVWGDLVGAKIIDKLAK